MIETERLLLRQWSDEDIGPFADMNADPVVMEYFPSVLTRSESEAVLATNRATIDEQGWGLWAVQVQASGEFIGFTGLWAVKFRAHFFPAVEVGWRLAGQHWGNGYATEAARAALAHGFDNLGLDEIVSFTAVDNVRSRRVMEKLAMTHDPAEDFDHPRIPAGHPLQRHVLYRLARARWDVQPSADSTTVS